MGERADAASFDDATFRSLQARLIDLWPALTLRTETFDDRVAVVVSSMTVPGLPEEILRVLSAYEERYLFYVLSLARAPRSRVVYVTSSPILPRVLEYYFGLLSCADPDDLRDRLTVVTAVDGGVRPLTAKLLERPRLLDRLRSAIATPDRAILLPFVSTPLEAELSVRLGIPLYGPHPSLGWLGTKSGARATFAAAGIAHPRGADVRTVDEIVDAVVALLDERPVDRVVVKLDDGVSGVGNAAVDLRGATDRASVAERVRALHPEAASIEPEEFLASLAEQGGVVEEWLHGEEVRSPSVQLRASPTGDVEELSTHDQVLGGRSGLTYMGCRFPADRQYRSAICTAAGAIGKELARQGVIGRFAVDFVVVRQGDRWQPYAIEINLRNGGTTHPAVTLLALTEARYDAATGRATSRGVEKCYVATDHLARPEYQCLTPDDVLDLIEPAGLGWDDASETGIAFHMLSAVAVAGQVGLTAIGDSPAQADALFRRAEAALDAAAGVPPGAPPAQ